MVAEEPPSEIVEVEAPDMVSAQDLVSTAINRRMTFFQTRTMVVSEELARTHFDTVEEYEDYDWMNQYPRAEVSVKMDITFTGFGKQLSPPNAERIED